MCNNLQPNTGKSLEIAIEGNRYKRLPIKTHVVTQNDEIGDICSKYASPHMRKNDLLFISEKIVAITQGRAYPIKEIKPSLLAKFLARFVCKSPFGIGLGSPWTMHLAIKEAGLLRIIAGTLAACLTRPFGIHGTFYKVAARNVNAIDGPCDYTIPPYNKFAILGPAEPGKEAERLKCLLNHDVVIIDANDLGVSVVARTGKDISDNFCKNVFRDNPLGQSSEQTPLCIVRKAD